MPRFATRFVRSFAWLVLAATIVAPDLDAHAASAPREGSRSFEIVGVTVDALVPGTSSTLVVDVALSGTAPVSGVTALLETDAAGVTLSRAPQSWPSIAPGTTVSARFAIDLASDVPCGTLLPIRLTLRDGDGAAELRFRLRVGSLARGPVHDLASNVAGSTAPRAVATAGGFALAFEPGGNDAGTVRLLLLDAAGARHGELPVSGFFAARVEHREAGLASNGTTLALVARDEREGNAGLTLALLDAASGAPASKPQFVPAGDVHEPRALWNATLRQWTVAFATGKDGQWSLGTTAFTADGRALAAPPALVTGRGSLPRFELLPGSTQPVLAWAIERAGITEVFRATGTRIERAGAVECTALDLDADATGALVLAGSVARADGMVPGLFSSIGGALGAVPLAGSDEPAGAIAAAVSAGDDTLVLWRASGLLGSSIRIAGGAAAGDVLAWAEPAATAPSVARRGDDLLVVWLEPLSSTLHSRLAGPAVTCGSSTPNTSTARTPQAPLADADGDGYAPPADCNDANPNVHPGALELCNGIDDNCDGTIDEAKGDRYVAVGGIDGINTCTNPNQPCATISQAVRVACTGETVRVAEGTYVEDVMVAQAINITGQGNSVSTQVKGTGSGDVVRLLASGIQWNGIEIGDTPGHACLRIGDAAHPNLRDVLVTNAALHGCRVGAIVDSTGPPPPAGGWNRLLGVDVRESVADGAADGGVGVLLVGGNGKLEFKTGLLRNNGGPGLRVKTPPSGAQNQSIVIAGNAITGNGSSPQADGGAGVEILAAGDVRLEGNDINGQIGATSGDDGRGVILDGVTSGNFFCNRVRLNDTGLVLRGGTRNVGIEQNHFTGNTVDGLRSESGAITGVSAQRNIFAGNGTGLRNLDAAMLSAVRGWWNSAAGPGGTGDAVSGAVDTSNYVARALAPAFVRQPQDSGWDPSADTCWQTVQQGVSNAAAGSLLLVGPGNYIEHVVMTTALDVEGVPAVNGGCSTTAIYGNQSDGSHLPAMRIAGVSNVSVTNLTLREASTGTPCGLSTGAEIGLDLQNVSGSSFANLCFFQNGVTELRVYGASSNNLFQNLTIDGMVKDLGGGDVCGHRSREGILVDGGPVCEGGTGAIATNNRFTGGSIVNCARDVSVRLANTTDVNGFTLRASPAIAWDGGTYATSVLVQQADNTSIRNNDIGSRIQNEGIRVAGQAAGSCVTERVDANNTTIAGNTIKSTSVAAIRNYRGYGDPGVPNGTVMTCNFLFQNNTGVYLDYSGAGAAAALVNLNDIRENRAGIRNLGIETLDATRNWYGSTTGPGGVGPGSGDQVFGSVYFAPWLLSSSSDDADADGMTECGGDCDDTNASVRPGAPEVCDGLDNNCNGQVDEGFPLNTYYRDADGDGHGTPAQSTQNCSSTPPFGYAASTDDCNDSDATIYTGAPEICYDGKDNNCNGLTDVADAACASLDVAGLRFTSRTALQWNAAGAANAYGLLRGTIDSSGFRAYNHSCGAAQLATATATVTDVPPAGRAFYYLAVGQTVDGTTGAITSGPVGRTSAGASVPDSSSVSCGPRVFVDAAATGAGTGLSWADAYTTLTAAMGHQRAKNRGLELWVRGTVSGAATLAGATRPGARILGGFAGGETLVSQRNPSLNVTTWSGNAAQVLLTLDHASAIVDGLRVETGTNAVRATLAGQAVEWRGVTASFFSAQAIDLATDGDAGARLVVDGSSFDAAGQRAIRAIANAGTIAGTIRTSTFAGAADAALRLEARPGQTAATISLELSRNTIKGGAFGLALGAYAGDGGGAAQNDSVVTSNMIYGTTSAGIHVEASGEFSTQYGPTHARAIPSIVGNTISDSGSNGIVCYAVRNDSTDNPAIHEIRATPAIWDNIVAFAAGAGISESADDVVNSLIADPVAVGNDLFGNGSVYLDEGFNNFLSPFQLNALPGNADNYSADPLFVNRPLSDYHVAPGSPVVNQGHLAAPRMATEDIDGQQRVRGGPVPLPDTGADELP